MAGVDITQLRAQIAARGFNWDAVALPPGQPPHGLGWNPTPAPVITASLASAQRLALLRTPNLFQFAAPSAAAPGPLGAPASSPAFPAAFDWRNRGVIGPVTDQKNCGSCVSFATTGLVGAMHAIEHSTASVHLSEADQHFCSAHGANCFGWNNGDALNEIKGRGVVTDADFPYMTGFDSPPVNDPADHSAGPVWAAHCRAVADRNAKAWHITDVTAWSGNDRKSYIANVGPLVCGFQVFEDFDNYHGGVYHHVMGNLRGGHAVMVIGYSDTEQCWICRNSWGTGFGDPGRTDGTGGGFFKIGYGECSIDGEAFHGAHGVVPPVVVAQPVVEQHNLFRSADGHIHALWFNFATGWHQEDRTALVTGTPAAVGNPCGYAFVNKPTGLLEQHNLFRSADGHIHALWFNFATGWHQEDRTALVAGTPAAVGDPFGYAFVNNPTGVVEQHNLFRAADGHIHALWFNFATGWHHDDRSALAVGSPPAAGDPVGYAFVNNATGLVEQHHLFRSADGHIHALWFNFATGWHHEDRTALVAGTPAAVGDPFGYAFINNATGVVEQHNLFRSADGHIHALWFNFATGWHHEDRTALVAGTPAAVGDPFGYAFVNNATGLVEQHNLFRSADGHIHALWFNFATGWHHEDRTALVAGTPAAVDDPFGYAFVNNATGLVEQHHLFRAADGHIHALWFNFATGWHHEDRTLLQPGTPTAVGDPFGYAFIEGSTGL
jgi:hypothetical protein